MICHVDLFLSGIHTRCNIRPSSQVCCFRNASNTSFPTGSYMKSCNVAEEKKKTVVHCFSVDAWSGFLFLSSDILKKFNPSIKGFSKDQFPKQKGFNMAVVGAKASYVRDYYSFITKLTHLKFAANPSERIYYIIKILFHTTTAKQTTLGTNPTQ